jgi:7-cyano-7-deazaguanine synthase in queuosine biosynthesis
MYSGGLDSVGMLYRLLFDEQWREFTVHVHHMHLHNREDRARAERLAVDSTLAAFRDLNCREFLFTESAHEYQFLRKRFIFDMDMSAFMAGNIAAADKRIAHVAMGRTRTDVDEGGERFQQRMDRAQTIFRGVLALEERELPTYIFPVLEYSKTEIWQFLPAEIRERAWSCRRPGYEGNTPVPCGTCNSCKELQAARELTTD